MSSIFGWKDRWWSSSGLVDWETNDAIVSPGGGFGPWGIDNKSIGTGKWTFEITYTATQDTAVNIFHTKFPEEHKDTGSSSVFVTKVELLAGSRTVKAENVFLDGSVPFWAPYFAIPNDAKSATFHNVEVFKTPAVNPGAHLGGIYVVGNYPDQANGGAGNPLSLESKVGDLAVLVVASQFGNTSAKPPAGWNGLSNPNIGGRSGYIASKWVTDPSDTQNVIWTGKTQSTARERAVMILLRNVEDAKLVPWSTTKPEITKPTLLFIQSHGAAKNKEPTWPKSTIRSGGSSDNASWSMIRGALVTEAPEFVVGDLISGYAGVELTPKSGNTEPTVEIHPSAKGLVRVLETDRTETPATMREMPFGYDNIVKMIRNRGYIIAHRGGSASWPESSMRAYTNAVARGAGALEVSCQKTKDGVWFLNHDRKLTRVDPSAPDTPVTEMTWADIQKYKTQGEPFMKVEDYFEAYGSSHITVLDPKYSAAQWSDLLRFLPKDAKDRVIWKFSIDATWLATQWKNDGWMCWGYSYEDHVIGGQINGWHGPWTFLGMPYDAQKTTWDKILTLGKPVWAHICPNKEAYDRGIANGAAGCMVSGIADLFPTQKV